uniref:Uncharacterized protein n=1 Tax=Avena sativa TaxID=4498 RepID=A0ACD5TJQ2_AVESA
MATMLPSSSPPPTPRGVFSPRCSLQAPSHAHRVLDGAPQRRHAPAQRAPPAAAAYAREIGACVRARRWCAACEAFAAMRAAGAAPDRFLFPQVLRACAGASAPRLAAAAHALAAKGGPALAKDGVVGNAVIAMYAALGDVGAARAAFASLSEPDVVAWTALVGAYSNAGELDEAFELFESMQASGVQSDVISWNTLVSGFARNSDIGAALDLFDEMRLRGVKPRVSSWNCIISGCMQNARYDEALGIFLEMCEAEMPDAVTIASMLPACTGLMALGLGKQLHSYVVRCGIKLNVYIGSSLIGMYSECREFAYARSVAAKAAKSLFEIEPNNTSNYMVLSNIYANDGLWDSTESVRDAMTEQGLHVERQCSWFYLGTRVDSFEAGDLSHPAFENILSTWKDVASRMEQSGYAPQDNEPYCNVEVDPLSCHHTERIAVCYGLISMCSHEPIRVLKNFRMCKECHSSIKFISRDKNRQILISDGCTYHHFNDGSCSCGDMW